MARPLHTSEGKLKEGHYIKIVYRGPKPKDDFETREEMEIEVRNTSVEHVKDWLERAMKIVEMQQAKAS